MLRYRDLAVKKLPCPDKGQITLSLTMSYSSWKKFIQSLRPKMPRTAGALEDAIHPYDRERVLRVFNECALTWTTCQMDSFLNRDSEDDLDDPVGELNQTEFAIFHKLMKAIRT